MRWKSAYSQISIDKTFKPPKSPGSLKALKARVNIIAFYLHLCWGDMKADSTWDKTKGWVLSR